MINQLLNRDCILDQMEKARKHLAIPPGERRRGGRIPDEARDLKIGEEDRQAALAALEYSLAEERAKNSGQTPKFPQGDEGAPLDDWSFISSDPIISNLQTVLDYYFTDGPGKEEVEVAGAPEGERRAPGKASLTGDAWIQGVGLEPGSTRRLFNKFSVTDPEWVSTGLAVGVRLLRGRRTFIDEAPVIRIADKVRMVMVGDWGSGINRARNVAKHMRTQVEGGLNEDRETHVVHLGDVYYSGWKREYQKRFLPYWPVKTGEQDKIFSWCLNGNHDMYSGGQGYFDFLLQDARFQKQKASFFCLENSNWKIFGLDSAHEDGGLRDPQADWVKGHLDPKKKSMIWTHHQPFSVYEKAAETMMQKLGPALGPVGRVKSWFWGHEHRFQLYEDHNRVEFGRLLGHGGVPVYMNHPNNGLYNAPEKFEDRRFIPKTLGLEHWAYFGFAVLDFDGPQVNVRYFDEEGNPSYSKPDLII